MFKNMKKIIYIIIGIVIGIPALTYGLSTFQVIQGGTGATTLTGCLTGNGTGAITGSGSACAPATYDAWTHPASGQSATTSLMLLYGNASSTLFSANTGFFNFINATTTTATSTFSGAIQLGGTAGDNALKSTARSGGYPASASVGAMFNLTNTNSLAAALTIYSNAGVGRLNDLLTINNDNAANDQRGLNITQDGTRNGALVNCTNATKVVGQECLAVTDVASSNTSTIGVSGSPLGVGLLKFTFNGVGNANSSMLSADASSAGYLGQGIFIDSSGGTWNNSKILNLRANGTEFMTFTTEGLLGLATTTPKWQLSIATTTGPQMSLLGAATDNAWTFRGIGNNFYIATSSPTTFATSSTAALKIDANGKVTANCFTVDGSTCLTSGGSGTVSTGVQGQIAYYNASGSTIVGTTTDPLYVGSLVATSTTATSTFFGGVNVTGGCFAVNSGCMMASSSNSIYINSSRSDSYTANGTIAYPYKTISAANTAVVAAGIPNAVYYLAPSTYTEQSISFPNIPLVIQGQGATILVLSGATVGAGTLTFPNDITYYDAVVFGNVSFTSSSLTNPHSLINPFIDGNVTFAGNSIILNGAVVDQNKTNFPFLTNNASSTITVNAGSLVNILGSNIQSVVTNKGTTNIDNSAVTTATSTRYAIDSSTAGSILRIAGMSLTNTGTGGAIDVRNGANVSAPNALSSVAVTEGTGSTNGIESGTASTFLNDYVIFTQAGVQLYATPYYSPTSGIQPLSNAGLNVEGNTLLNVIAGNTGLGTSTPAWPLQISTSTASLTFKPQIAISDQNAAANKKHWTFSTEGGLFYMATSSDAYATSSVSAFSLNLNGFPTFPAIKDGCVNIASGLLGSTGASCASGSSSSKKIPSYVVAASGGDFTTIQGAMTQCGTDGGGNIYLTDPTYAQGATGLTWRGSNCNIYGRSGTTTITFTGATTLFKTNSAVGIYSNTGLHNLVLLGDGNTSGVAVDASDMSHSLYEDIVLDNVGRCIKLNDTQNITFYNTFKKIDCTTITNIGIDASSTNPVNANIFEDIFLGSSASNIIGLQLTNGNNNHFKGLRVEPGSVTGTVGIKIFDNLLSTNDGVFDNIFENSYIEANGTGLSIAATVSVTNGGVQRNQFIGGIFDANTTDLSIADPTKNNFIGIDNNFGNPINSFQALLGVGTTTPFGLFSINPTAGTASNIFVIGSSTATILQVDNSGNFSFGTPIQPVLSSCGSSPTLYEGNNTNGIINVGTGASVTACTITFAGGFPVNGTKVPVCMAQMSTTTGITLSASTTRTTLLISTSGSVAASRINYQCFGNLK